MRKTIANDLYNFLYDMQVEKARGNPNKLIELVAGLEKLKNHDFKKKVVATSEEDFTNEDIQFDNKWNLLPFKNGVYDLETHIFREHRYDD
jgi:phage/plasmid-associated DNA primase